VFNKGLGTIKGFKAEIKLQDGAKPVFCKARPAPSALRQKDEEGRKKVESSNWAFPIVCVSTKDKSVRICGDCKMSVKKILLDNLYPFSDTDDIFATPGSGTMFSKIDLSNAYQQMGLSAESLHFLTVETHKGLHTYQRLTYGFASAPALFGSTVDHKL